MSVLKVTDVLKTAPMLLDHMYVAAMMGINLPVMDVHALVITINFEQFSK